MSLHDGFDELEDLLELVMGVNVPVARQARADVSAYLTGLWALSECARAEISVDAASQNEIKGRVAVALARLRSFGAEEIAIAVKEHLATGDVWRLPDENDARTLLSRTGP